MFRDVVSGVVVIINRAVVPLPERLNAAINNRLSLFVFVAVVGVGFVHLMGEFIFYAGVCSASNLGVLLNLFSCPRFNPAPILGPSLTIAAPRLFFHDSLELRFLPFVQGRFVEHPADSGPSWKPAVLSCVFQIGVPIDILPFSLCRSGVQDFGVQIICLCAIEV